jgi:hypothetical protein
MVIKESAEGTEDTVFARLVKVINDLCSLCPLCRNKSYILNGK